MARTAHRPACLRAPALALALVLALVAGCTRDTGPTPPSTELVVGATAAPPSLDAVTNTAAAIPQVTLYNVYQTMVTLGDDGTIQPGLATAWVVSDDNLVYTFTLNPKATFSTGHPVTAESVVKSLQRVRRLGTDALKQQLQPVKDVTAPDAHTVKVTLSQPSNMWLFNMTQAAGIVSDPAVTELGTSTAGSGPYEITGWQPGQDVVLTLRPDYPGPQPFLTKITFRYFSDPNAENAAMLAGQLDVLSSLQAPQALDQFADPSRFTVLNGTTNGEVVMSFNFRTKALQDKRVRQAINYAIDRTALLDTVWNGQGLLIGSMVPPTDPWYEDLSGTYPYDPAKAKQLLAAAGYSATHPLKLRLRLPTLPYATASGQFVASALTDVGIDVVSDELEFPARWLDVVYTKGDYDMSIIAHVEPRDIIKYADPNYYWHYDNPEVRKLVAAADRGTQAQQTTDLRKVAKILADDAAADWLFLLPNLVITKPGIDGIPKNAAGLSFDLTKITRT